MPRPATAHGVTRLASGKYRWRVMIDGVRHTGIADTEAAAKLARTTLLNGSRRCPTCGKPMAR